MEESGDAYVAILSGDLSRLIASTYFSTNEAAGGCSHWAGYSEWGLKVALDSSGNTYMLGLSYHCGVLPGPGYKIDRPSGFGVSDTILPMVVKFTPDLSRVLGSTFVGGDRTLVPYDWYGIAGLKIDKEKNVFIANSLSPYWESGQAFLDFPTTNGAYITSYDINRLGCVTGFVSKLSGDLTQLLASTLIGAPWNGSCGHTSSAGYTYIRGLDIDAYGNVYIAGCTDSYYPTTPGAYDTTKHGDPIGNYAGDWAREGFISKFNNNLTTLLASTYLAGDNLDKISAMVIDSDGNVCVAGLTFSDDFPTTPGAYDTQYDRGGDGFVAKLDASLSRLLYSTYFGRDGTTVDHIAIDREKKMIIAGSNLPDSMVTAGAYDPTPNVWNRTFVAKLQEPKELVVSVLAPRRVSPGQEADIVIRYLNGLDFVARQAVVRLQIPEEFNYVFATRGGIYRKEGGRCEVFWRLGDLPPRQRGELAVKVSVPWGLPSYDVDLLAEIGAENVPSSLNIDFYLNFDPVFVTSVRELSAHEARSLLGSDQELNNLFQYALGLGYLYYDQAIEVRLSNGSGYTVFPMVDRRNFGPVLLMTSPEGKIIQRLEGNKYYLMDQKGGFSVDLNNWDFRSWGEWLQENSSSSVGFGVKEHGYSKQSESVWFVNCVWNCAIELGPLGIGGRFLKTAWNAVSGGWNCWTCYSLGLQCTQCLVEPVQFVVGQVSQDNLEIFKCVNDCRTDPRLHSCTAPWKWCTRVIGRTPWSPPKDLACRRKCENGRYEIFPHCEACGGLTCVNGECLPWNLERCLREMTKSFPQGPSDFMGASPDALLDVKDDSSPIYCGVASLRMTPAHDPNAKSVDSSGNVLPGQRLTYTIEYENVGTGTAYGVFVVDRLDTDLEPDSLTIGDGGQYFRDEGVIVWEIGTLPPCTQTEPDVCRGSVSFSVNVKDNLPSGTEIVNYAEVHFPSANEVTPTNPVVSIVKGIAADPMEVEAVSGTPVAITLRGRDTGNSALTYRITRGPLYGQITGTPPGVTYTSMEEFSGQDELYYVVSNGLIESEPARVVIKVLPNPSDENPPTVVSTYPRSGETNVVFSAVPASPNPPQYVPIITATFSEQIDESTIGVTTFLVDGIVGEVFYDPVTRTASFVPSTPLSPSTLYTARITEWVTDRAGTRWMGTMCGISQLPPRLI